MADAVLRHAGRALAAAVLAALLLLAAAPPASATRLATDESGAALYISPSPGDRSHRLTVTLHRGSPDVAFGDLAYDVVDERSAIDVISERCTRIMPSHARCAVDSNQGLMIDATLSAGSDLFELYGLPDDPGVSLFGSFRFESVVVRGGGGHDVIRIRSGAVDRAELVGGEGWDELSLRPLQSDVREDRPGEYQTGYVEESLIDGGPGRDTLTGGWGNDEILGGEDSDTIDGREGGDILDGGAGNDYIASFDEDVRLETNCGLLAICERIVDAPVQCGPGADQLWPDADDEWYDCERVHPPQ